MAPTGRTAAVAVTAAALLVAPPLAWWLTHRSADTVRQWRPGAGRQVRLGPLWTRVLGDDHPDAAQRPVVLLLHGMLGAGAYFGDRYDVLADDATLVVPDLLGFAGSMAAAGPWDEAAHVAALEAALAALGPGRRRVLVLGHSMGASLALRWAARTVHHVTGVVGVGPPLYRDDAEAGTHVAAMGLFERVLSGDTRTARATCDWMCAHRSTAQWVAVAMRPDLPVPVGRAVVRHTWFTYRGAMTALIRDPGWQPALTHLLDAGVDVRLLAGRRDPVPAPGQLADAETLHTQGRSVRVAMHPDAAHDLPISHAGWVLDHLPPLG